jgi:hypothetical protein
MIKNKNIVFLCSLPRAGNTLLGSLINQSEKIKMTPNTVLCDVLYNLSFLINDIKKNEIFLNFPDEVSLNNIENNLFNSYYKHWKADYIIERGPWGTPANLKLIEKIYKNNLKFIILTRPVLEVIASFVKLFEKNNQKYNIENWMSPEGIIGKNLWSIKNVVQTKQNYLIINFSDLIKNPEKEISNIFNYLELKKEKIKFKNFKQFEINGIKYKDIKIKNLHKLRTKVIKNNKINYRKYLTKETINKYSNLDLII